MKATDLIAPLTRDLVLVPTSRTVEHSIHIDEVFPLGHIRSTEATVETGRVVCLVGPITPTHRQSTV